MYKSAGYHCPVCKYPFEPRGKSVHICNECGAPLEGRLKSTDSLAQRSPVGLRWWPMLFVGACLLLSLVEYRQFRSHYSMTKLTLRAMIASSDYQWPAESLEKLESEAVAMRLRGLPLGPSIWLILMSEYRLFSYRCRRAKKEEQSSISTEQTVAALFGAVALLLFYA